MSNTGIGTKIILEIDGWHKTIQVKPCVLETGFIKVALHRPMHIMSARVNETTCEDTSVVLKYFGKRIMEHPVFQLENCGR